MALLTEEIRYSFADYLEWDENDRIELLDGVPYMLAAPSAAHQIILMEIARQLANYLDGKKCKVIPAPFTVRLFEKEGDTPEDVRTVVEPDISVVCDTDKLDKHGCKGAPDLVIEILSPSSLRNDRVVKLHQYQRAGVREYWIVSPDEETVQVLTLENGNLIPQELYGKEDAVPVGVLDNCSVDLCKVFPE